MGRSRKKGCVRSGPPRADRLAARDMTRIMKICKKHGDKIEYDSGVCPECFLTELFDDGEMLLRTNSLIITPLHERALAELKEGAINWTI